jgi:hypothetical protein
VRYIVQDEDMVEAEDKVLISHSSSTIIWHMSLITRNLLTYIVA